MAELAAVDDNILYSDRVYVADSILSAAWWFT